MRILIDGYNLIRRIPELRVLDESDLKAGRDALIRQLSLYRSASRHRLTVIFDGTGSVHLGGGDETVSGVSVRYSPRGRTADVLIREAVSTGRADVLVSADRELVQAARRAGVTPVWPELFWDRLCGALYRSLKGDENGGWDEEEYGRRKKAAGRRKGSKAERRDRARIGKL